MATVGGVEQVREIVLLDSLYADFSQFDAFVQNNLEQFGTDPSQYRFSSVFTVDGGTYQNNVAMEKRALGWVEAADMENILFIDNSESELSVQTIENYSLLFKLTSLDHNDVPRRMFYDFLIGTAWSFFVFDVD